MKRNKRVPEQLVAPEFPQTLQHVWDWFLDLSGTRPPAFSGIQPIDYKEILAWCELTDEAPTPYEISLIRALDEAYIRILGNDNGRRDKD